MSPSSSVARRSRCPACGGGRLEPFHEVNRVPVNSCILIDDRRAALDFPSGAIVLALCDACGFITNAAFDESRIEYSASYEETQGFSPRFRQFASDLACRLVDRHGLRDRDVLEIGCGKGEFLALLCELGPNRGVGIDPSYHPGRLDSPASARMTFVRDFYGPENARSLTGDLICCRHTLEHIGPVGDFVADVRRSAALREGSVVFFEVPDVMRVLREGAFWDIYYEHCSYFSPGSLTRLFARSGFDVEPVELAFDDQYLLLTARVGQATQAEGGEPVAAMRREVARFRNVHAAQVAEWRRVLGRMRGRRPVLWGSGSKAVAWLTTLGIGDEIGYVVDINPHKHGKFLAGTGHEIVPPQFLVDYRPDVVIAMNPVYRDEIRRDLQQMGLSPELLSV